MTQDNKFIRSLIESAKRGGNAAKEQLFERVGEPREESMTEEGAEILKYKCTTTKDNKFVLFPPRIIIDNKKETEHTVVFKIRDSIVQRHWKEP